MFAPDEVAIVPAMNCGSFQFSGRSFQGAVFTAGVEFVQDFGKLFVSVAGHHQTIRATRSRIFGFLHRIRPGSASYYHLRNSIGLRKTDGGKLMTPSLVTKSKRRRVFVGLVAT